MVTFDLRLHVKNFRSRLGLSQTEFGRLIGKSLPTVQRYENLVPPRGRVLTDLAELASRRGAADLARIFRQALSDEIAADSVHLKCPACGNIWILDPENTPSNCPACGKSNPFEELPAQGPPLESASPQERRYLAGVLDILRGDDEALAEIIKQAVKQRSAKGAQAPAYAEQTEDKA